MKQPLVLSRWKLISRYFRCRSLKMSEHLCPWKGIMRRKHHQWRKPMDWFLHTLRFIISPCFRIHSSSYIVQASIPNSARFYLQSQTGHLGMVESILLHCLRFCGGTLLSGWHDMSSWHSVYMAWSSTREETSLRAQGTATAPHPPLLLPAATGWESFQVESLKAGERRGSCGQLAVEKGQSEIIRTTDIRQQKCLCFSLG